VSAVKIRANYYQQFDADVARDVPGEGYGGWKQEAIEIEPAHTALVVMHSWANGTSVKYPGWWRAVEYMPRANEICKTVFPRLLGVVRRAGWTLFHVVGGGDYYRNCPGYLRAVSLAGPTPPHVATVVHDPVIESLGRFRGAKVFPGEHNQPDIKQGFASLGFGANSEPLGDEGVAENGHQLFALCRHHGINHLVYAGFAINWCLLMSPGGMHEMAPRGILCSAIRQAVTAVENRESARTESHKEEALWRVALAFGFVFDLDDFVATVESCRQGRK